MKLLAILLASAVILIQCVEPRHCTDPAFPYWCPKSDACCSYAYTDGKSCFASLQACTSSGGSCETCSYSGTGGSHYYANWTCKGSAQCSTVMGAAAGTAGPFCDPSACAAWGQKYIPGGYTCSTTGQFSPSGGSPPNGRCFQVGDF